MFVVRMAGLVAGLVLVWCCRPVVVAAQAAVPVALGALGALGSGDAGGVATQAPFWNASQGGTASQDGSDNQGEKAKQDGSDNQGGTASQDGSDNHVGNTNQGENTKQDASGDRVSVGFEVGGDSVAGWAVGDLPVGVMDWVSVGLVESVVNVAAPAAGGSGDAEADIADGMERESDAAAGAAASGLSVGGMAATQNSETLDGLSSVQNFGAAPRGSGTGRGVSMPDFAEGAVRQARLLPHTYTAEFGGAAGAVLAVTSQAGSERWHGGAFGMLRMSAFAAVNPYSVATTYQDGVVSHSFVKPENTLVQFGGRLGMPVGSYVPGFRRKLAMFVSYEGEVRNDPAVSTPATTAFYALTATQVALLGNRGVSAAATNAALNYLDGLSGLVARSSTRGLGFARLDDRVGLRDHVTVTYTRNRISAPAGAGYAGASNAVVASGRGSVGDSTTHVDAFAAHWVHAFSPRLEHVLRFQMVRDLDFDTPRAPLLQEPAIGPGGYAPEVEIAPNGFAYGTPANLGREAYPDERRLQMADELSWVRGRQRWIAGFDWSRIHDRIEASANPDGTFLYDSGVTGGHAGGLVDWITDDALGVNAYPSGGCPSVTAAVHYFCFRSFTQSFGSVQTEFVTHELAGFVEDAFRPRKDLLLSLGVRYEYTLLPFPQAPNVALDAALSAAGTQYEGATSSFPEDRNDVGPRVSAAWSPRGWVAVHVGYGVYYGRLAGATVRSALADTALADSTLQVRIRPTTVTVCPQRVTVGFGFPCDYVSAPPAAVAETSSAMLFAKNFRVPAVQRASLSVEREVGKHGFVRVAYAMAMSTQLPGSVDVNVAPATAMASYVLQGGDGYPGLRTGETFVVPLYTQRRVAQYGPVTALVSNVNATYHAGTVEAGLRAWRGLEARGSFTFSRAIDYAPQISATPRVSGQFDPFDHGFDKGLSTLQFPERFSGDLIYRVELKGGAKWVREALNGWRAAAIGVAGSGAPYSYEISGGTYLAGGHETINGSGGASYLPTVGRNTLRLAAHGTVDARLERGFAVRKGWTVSGFAEAFNLLNERNLTRVETRAFLLGTPASVGGAVPLIFQNAAAIASEGLAGGTTGAAFGTATSSTSGVSRERQMEFGARLEF